MAVGRGWDPPDEVRDRVEFHWFHVVPGRSLLLCMLSTEPLWYVGHFEKGRMRPCLGAGCEPCTRGVGTQLRYVVSAVEVTTKQLGVIEMSKSVALAVKDFASSNGGLHGLLVEFVKSARSKHSRMECMFLNEHAPGWAFAMQGLDLAEVLARTWERQER